MEEHRNRLNCRQCLECPVLRSAGVPARRTRYMTRQQQPNRSQFAARVSNTVARYQVPCGNAVKHFLVKQIAVFVRSVAILRTKITWVSWSAGVPARRAAGRLRQQQTICIRSRSSEKSQTRLRDTECRSGRGRPRSEIAQSFWQSSEKHLSLLA